MSKTHKAWKFIQNDHYFAAKCKKAGLKVIPFDTEDGRGPAYEVFATDDELDRVWSEIHK